MIETLEEKYELPKQFESKVRDSVEILREIDGPDEEKREHAATHCEALIAEIMSDQYTDFEFQNQIREYLNGVITSLYGNDDKRLE